MVQNGLFPVSTSRHRDRFWRRYTSFDFAKEMCTCELVGAEILPAAAAFPVAFQKQQDSVLPVAVLSTIPEHKTPFVSAAGQWMAGYVPSSLRCHPFSAGPASATAGSKRLFVNEVTGLVTTDSRDIPFFTDEGVLTPELQDVLKFFKHREFARDKTRNLTEKLAKLDLFAPLTQCASGALPDNLLGIDTKRLHQLSRDHVALLFSAGAMQLIHAHQVSLSHFGWLERAQQHASVSAQKTTGSTRLNGFLSALAEDSEYSDSHWEVACAV